MMRRFSVVACLLILAGCASVTRTGVEKPTSTARYQAEPGRDAATIAEMRAAPAPAVAELVVGKNRTGDHDHLVARGFVLIGTGHFAGPEPSAREAAIRQGRDVGADRIVLYAPSAPLSAAQPATAEADWIATYYVRFQLPFGATFRDLRAQERKTLAAGGGVVIGAVIGGTPASRSNLMSGDVVLKLDRSPIADRAAFQALLKRNAGHPVTLTIVRNGETLRRVVRLGAMPAASAD